MLYRLLLCLTIVWSAMAFGVDPNYGGMNDLTVNGIVRGTSGHPIGSARVELRDANTMRTAAVGYSLPNGTFEIRNVPRGSYDILVFAGVSQAEQHLDLTMFEGSVTLTVNDHDSQTSQVGSSSAVSVSQLSVPDRAKKALRKAQEAFRAAHIDEAFGFVQKALAACPTYAQALTLRGLLHMQKGDTVNAQPDLEKAVQLDYTTPMSLVALGALYNTEGQYQRAQQTLARAETVEPNSWQLYFEMAKAQLGQKDFKGSVRTLEKAKALAPQNFAPIHAATAQALIGLKDYRGAADELQAYLQGDPEGPMAKAARDTLAKLQTVITADNQALAATADVK